MLFHSLKLDKGAIYPYIKQREYFVPFALLDYYFLCEVCIQLNRECFMTVDRFKWIRRAFFTLAITLSPMVFSADSSLFTKEWQGWVEERHENLNCPWQISNEGKRVCEWPGSLHIDMVENGLQFEFTVEVFSKNALVQLPGDVEYWPIQITRNQKRAPVVQRDNKPYLALSAGKNQIKGTFQWQRQPAGITIPTNIAFISITEKGTQIPVNQRGDKLIFSHQKLDASVQKRDSINVEVYRLLQDGVPMTMETRLKLSVSGKPREMNIGRLALTATEAINLSSQLPARIEEDGSIRVQVKAGEYQIVLRSRFLADVDEIRVLGGSQYWPQYEYLGFKHNTDIRQAVLNGATSIDTSQVPIPSDWRSFPTYRLSADTILSIQTEVRGDKAPVSNQLVVNRELWLDFDGDAITALDTIEGNMYQQWRLNSNADTHIGRATVAGEPVLITENEGRQGVEIRSPNVALKAVTRISEPGQFTATGWASSADSYNATLNLPPGWRVLFVSGADSSRGPWFNKWDLWDIFLLLVLVAATKKLIGIKTAVFTGITLLATFHENATPLSLWPVLLFLIAILPVLKDGRLKSLLSGVGVTTAAILIIVTIAFAVSSFRLAIYPTLEKHSVSHYGQSRELRFSSSVPEAADVDVIAEQKGMELDDMARMKVKQEPTPRSYRTMYQVDENDRVQTGPGLPTWKWNSVRLSSSGPVAAEQEIKVVYCPPFLTSLWRVFNVLLIAGLAYLLLKQLMSRIKFSSVRNESTATSSALVVLILFAMSTMPTETIASDYPPKHLLSELEKRLLKIPSCFPSCVSLNNGLLNASKDRISLSFDVYSETDLALPIPSGAGNWNPDDVLIDGYNKVTAGRNGGKIVLLMRKGHHKVTLSGKAIGDQLTIVFPLAIHNFVANSDYWIIEGLIDARIPNNTLSLSAKTKVQQERNDTLMPDPVDPFVIVHREFLLEKQWRLKTTVERIAPIAGAISVNIPLLSEEKVLSDISITEGLANIQLKHSQKRLSWHSSLEPVEKISLVAAPNRSYLETWRIRPSSLWRIDYQGIPPVKEQGKASSLQPHWKPWPTEQLHISINRPEGVQGEVQTVEKAALTYRPGYQLQKSTLSLDIRASQGDAYTVGLPVGAEVTSLQLNGKRLNTPSANKVTVQLQPGVQNLEIQFQERQSLGWLSETPKVELPGNTANITIQYHLSRDRWPLYVSGPAIGPAMLIWGILIVIVLGAVVLPLISKRFELEIPVRLIDWLLLGIGLSTVNSYGVLIVALFFFVLAARKQKVHSSSMSYLKFNFLQAAVLVLTVITVVVLIAAIPSGLLSTPNMKVIGNGSSSTLYNYYQDRAAAGFFPSAHIYSVSLMGYRFVMLVWSLWLATRLISWSIWWWSAFSAQTAWRPRPIIATDPAEG